VPAHILLGRSVGITDKKISPLGDDPLPDGVFEPAEAAIVRYAQLSTRMQPIGDELYKELTDHFDVQQIIELCMTVSLSNQVNRFHATFLTDLDEDMADALSTSCPLPLPPHPSSVD
jgi:alkylhydroperoxidase family enzyme